MDDVERIAKGPSRFLPTLWAGLLAYNIARAIGVPIWMDDHAGDATDIALMAAFLVFALLGFWRRLAVLRVVLGEGDGNG